MPARPVGLGRALSAPDAQPVVKRSAAARDREVNGNHMMSDFTRFRRSSRLRAFRHLFPEVVAPWIQMRRLLLRCVRFWTLPVDHLLDELLAVVTWPLRMIWLVTQAAWLGIVESFEEVLTYFEKLPALLQRLRKSFPDLSAGLREASAWVRQLPVWSAAALAGTFGIMLTLLLFLFASMPRAPVPASTRPLTLAAPPSQPVPAAERHPLQDALEIPPAAGNEDPVSDAPQAMPAFTQPEPDSARPLLLTSFRRMRLPFDWDPTRTFDVVSTRRVLRERTSLSELSPFSPRDGWKRAEPLNLPPASAFVPYMTQAEVRLHTGRPEWLEPTSEVGSFASTLTQRRPTVHIEKLVPRHSNLGEPLHYVLLVENRGEEALDDVSVREHVPDLERIAQVHPPATIVNGELHWALKRLEPGARRRLSIELRPTRVTSVQQTSHVEVTTQVASTTFVPAPVESPPEPQAPELELVAETEDQPFLVDDDERAPVETKPQLLLPPERPVLPWSSPTTPVAPLTESDEHPEAVAEPVEEKPFRPATPIAAPASPPAIQLRTRIVEWVGPGHDVWTVFEVDNRGTSDAIDLLLQVRLSPELSHKHGRVLEHTIPRIMAGETYRTRLTTQALQTGTGRVQTTLTDHKQIEEQANASCEIRPPHEPPERVVWQWSPTNAGCPCGS